MAKKQKPKSSEPAEKRPATLFRADDPRLMEALDEYTSRIRNSRNMAMNILLERALKEEGLWPPKE